jgi:hypothetical protein
MTAEEFKKYGVNPSDVLDPEDFPGADKSKTVASVNPAAPTGDTFFDLMTGRGPKQDAPDGKWRIKK